MNKNNNSNSNNHSIFLHWFWLASIIFTSLGYCYNLGFFNLIYKYDVSHLTLLIYAIFICITLRIGYFSWKIDSIYVIKNTYFNRKRRLEDFLEMVNTNATRCQYIGVIGTVLGIGLSFSMGEMDKANLLAKVGVSVYNIIVSMTAFVLLDIQSRHVALKVRKKFRNETD
jgi:hypothetical protein